VTRLLLVRHGEPAEEAHGRCYGTLDVGLSERGREQARRLAGLPVDAVYSSPRRRALETAACLGVEPTVDERLRELDFGTLEGRTYDEIEASEPELFRRWMETPTEVRFPGGECYADLQARALAAAGTIRERHDGETVAIVSHGGVIRAILADALAMPPAAIFRLAQDYGAVSELEWVDGVPVVLRTNCVSRRTGR
jgi:broad specificity phosphatase PhoE